MRISFTPRKRLSEPVWATIARTGRNWVFWLAGERPLVAEGTPTARVLVQPANTGTFESEAEQEYARLVRRNGGAQPSVTQVRQISARLLPGRRLLDWQDIHDEAGTAVPFSTAAAEQLLSADPELLNLVATIANELEAQDRSQLTQDEQALGND